MRRPGIALAAVAALALGACGGGGGSSGPSKPDYIKRADAICRAARADALPLVRQLTAHGISPSPSQGKALAGTARRLQATEARYLARLRALEQPKGDAQAIGAFMTPAGQVVDAIGRAATALQRSDVVTTLSLLGQAQASATTARNAADAYGFRACGDALALAA